MDGCFLHGKPLYFRPREGAVCKYCAGNFFFILSINIDRGAGSKLAFLGHYFSAVVAA